MFNLLQRAIYRSIEKGWDKVYVAIDLHETIVKPSYIKQDGGFEFYNYSKEVLQYLSNLDYIVLILYSSILEEQKEEILNFFKVNNIHFKYINENPEVEDTEYASFKDKFYFNLLWDDKCGFDSEFHWYQILRKLNNLPNKI